MKYKSLISVLMCGACLMLSACSPPTADFDGRKLTADQIDAALEAKMGAAKKQLEADAKAAAEEIRSAQEAQKILQAKVQRDYALKLQKLTKNAEVDAAATSNELADTLASSNGQLANRLGDIMVSHDETQSRISQAAADAKTMADIAQADIQRQIDERGMLLQFATAITQAPGVKQGLDATGLGGLLSVGVGALATGWLGRARGSQARHDAVWDEAFAAGKAASEEKHIAANQAFDDASIRALLLNTPPPKATS